MSNARKTDIIHLMSTAPESEETTMTKVAFIVPYTDKGDWVQFIDHILKDIQCPPNVTFDILCTQGRVEDLMAEWTGDIVISRGLSYSVLKQGHHDFHLIECSMPNMELLKAVQAAGQLGARRIALFAGVKTPVELQLFRDLCHMEIELFEMGNDDDAKRQFQRMQADGGFDAVVGGYTICRMAGEIGIPTVPLRMGEEAARNAIHEALSVIEGNRREKQRNELLNCMIEMMEEGIVSLDSRGKILKINQICMKMFRLKKNVVNAPAADRIPKVILDVREGSTVVKLNGRDVLVRRSPIVIDGEPDGTIIMLQYVENLQKTEIAVRQKMNEKGLVAKYQFPNIIGSSPVLRKAVGRAVRFAQTDSDILITGESGTGKELFAQSIHNASARRKRPFVAFNCGALAPNLIESELFGYVGGAFTGAAREGKLGLFELAHKGTLFMDEIGELPLSLQASLLRVLQEKEIRRLGDDKIIPIDVRVIAATNVDIRERARSGSFRADLFYRLDILHLTLPPLRNRPEDLDELIPYLTRNFIWDGKPVVFEQAAVERLKSLRWQGNVRQLRNVCQRLSILSQTGRITETDVEEVLADEAEDLSIPETSLSEEERALYALVQRKQTKAELAKKLGVSRSTLWRKTRETK